VGLLVEFFRELILSLGPNLKALLDKYLKTKQNEVIDQKNVSVIKKDIDEGADREAREKDVANLINGKQP
jgi:hypothetical protein